MAEATGLGGLATFSRGFGDERYVSVMREGSQPSRVRLGCAYNLMTMLPALPAALAVLYVNTAAVHERMNCKVISCTLSTDTAGCVVFVQ